MTKHRSSIPQDSVFTPPPPVALGDAGATTDESVLDEPQPKAPAPSRLRNRLAGLLALLAVPAMAAPGDFGALAGDAPGEPVARDMNAAYDTALAFEKPGMSFPGSAFYYLADPPEAALVALPTSDPLDRGAVGADTVGALIDAGPAARAFVAGSGASFLRAKDCLAQAVWYEAASESEAGQRAVAQVVLNRVAHPSWPASVCGVVYEGSQRSTGCQFTFTCDGSLVRRNPASLNGQSWDRAQRIASQALGGSVYAPIGHATHYHTLWVDPYWAKALDPVGVIGAHRFYRNRGQAGELEAFTARYSGEEPGARTPVSSASGEGAPGVNQKEAPTDPVIRVQEVLETTEAPPEIATKDPEARDTTSGQAREKFRRAGAWKVDPSTLSIGAKPEAPESEQLAQTEAEPPASSGDNP